MEGGYDVNILMRKLMSAASVAFLFAAVSVSAGGTRPITDMREFAVKHTDVPVNVDGKLDDPAWQNATVYAMNIGKDRAMLNQKLCEGGEVMMCWDDRNLYVGVRFHDSDVCTEVTEDQVHAYGQGDTLEWFIKPENSTWYWELYATPNNKKTTFWFPSRGRILPSCFKDYKSGLRVAAGVNGTLNNWRDTDEGWTAEMAMPLADLTAYGDKFEPGAKWRVLVARYNYSRCLPRIEYTMCPVLTQTNYHLYERYAPLWIKR